MQKDFCPPFGARRLSAGSPDSLDDDRQCRPGPPRPGERDVDRDHRRSAEVDGVDDLGAGDALQVDRGIPRLVWPSCLDDDQRDAVARHPNGVRVAELMKRDAPAQAGSNGGVAALDACGAR
jgi:hypothetical protein